ncbi:MAG TPA: CHAT domain-containing tetratricopeptide repeat protein [Thermoanaerobaculia bacterium]|jgi:CHAT domain-containing protein|nr:CHAT domain-containing tetratricopeptide repeat protein [Thermoanaerobaculia bacterium]
MTANSPSNDPGAAVRTSFSGDGKDRDTRVKPLSAVPIAPVRRRGTEIATVCAIGLVLLIASGLGWYRLSLPSPFRKLVAAADALEYRVIDGRLSGGFRFKPQQSIVRNGAEPARSTTLRHLATAIAEAAYQSRSVENLHALGVAQLLLGRYDDAVDSLNEALISDSATGDLVQALGKDTNAALLLDVSGAYQARGQYRERPQDFVVAIEAAERAWSLARTPEVSWNRALAIESMHLRDDAKLAWSDYLALDSDSLWTQQARRRLDALRAPSDADRWKQSIDLLRKSAITGDTGTVAAIVCRYPEQTRTFGEEEMLTEWAAAISAGDVAAAEGSLHVAEEIGAALVRLTGEATLSDSADAIRHSGTALVSAHIAYRDAQKLQKQQQMGESYQAWIATEKMLRLHRSPLALRAAVFAQSANYFLGNGPAAVQQLSSITDDRALDQRYPSAVAQAWWLRALILCASGRQTEGIRDYQRALALFERTKETENVAAIHNRLAANLSYVGQADQAWRHRAEALRILDGYGKSSRLQTLLVDTARAAEDDGYLRASLRFHDQLVRLVRTGDPVFATDAFRARSVARWKAGLRESALADLQSASATADLVHDAAMKERLVANIRSAESAVFRDAQPQRSIRAATEAIAFYERVANRLRLADMYIDRALDHEAGRDFNGAESDLHAATDVLEQQRQSLRTPADRNAFLERRRNLFQTGVRLFVDHGDFGGAITFGEIARARSILDAAPSGDGKTGAPLTAAEISAQVPDQTAVLWYAVLPDRLVTNVIRRGRSTGFVQKVSARRIQELIARAIDPDPRNAAATRAASADLYDILIRPAAAQLEPTLVIVPDALLHAVAVSALFDRRHGRYLVEDHDLMLAPSASIFAGHQRQPTPMPTETAVFGNPTFEPTLFPDLPRLPGAEAEAREIGKLYGQARVVTGKEATREEFVNAARRGALIHYAGHAVFDSLDGAALLLASSGRDNGRVTAADIATIPMEKVSLLVLSACGTWKQIENGSGPLGLAEVFLRAGVHTVVASLAPVEDGSASHLLVAFHEALRSGDDAAAALRKAQCRLIHNKDPQLRAPSAWSRFVVIM